MVAITVLAGTVERCFCYSKIYPPLMFDVSFHRQGRYVLLQKTNDVYFFVRDGGAFPGINRDALGCQKWQIYKIESKLVDLLFKSRLNPTQPRHDLGLIKCLSG